MKLHRLEIEGFGPFRDRQLVDFDAFADDGIFLIAGRTGAGKSSLLDGVCFALYGGVPRYDGGEKRLRSDHCEPDDPTEVRLEFTVAGVRWRVTRSPEYPRRKRRGDGFTIEGARAQLEEFVHGGWRGTASGPRDVALELDEILGLTQDQFLQVILLAQNKFQRFLLAKNDERQAVLRTLFGSRRYEEYQNALEGRRREAERALTSRGDALGLLLGEAERIVREHDLGGDASDGPTGSGVLGLDERRDALERATQRADYRASAAVRDRDAADAAHTAATAAHAAQTALHALHEQRARSRDAFARLEGEAAEVAADRERHDRALRAETLRATLDAARRTTEAAHRAGDVVEAARALWVSAGGADLDAPALRALIDDLTGHLAVWEAARGREREHDDLAQRLLGEHTAVAELQKALAALDEQRGNIPEELARVDADLRTAGDAAAVLDSVREQLAEVRKRLVAAREAEQLAKDLRMADIAHAERVEAHGAATTAVGALMRTRLAGYAGELAGALVDGEPCTVCGAIEHPAPAERSHFPVTDDEVTAAEALRERAADGEREAAVRARAARDAYAAAAARAGGDPTDHLEETHARAQSAVDAAVSAATRRDALTEQRSQLVAFDTASAAERADLLASLASAREKVAVTTTTVDALADAVTAARGEFDTVAARIADAARTRALAQKLTEALTEASDRDRAARDAEADLGERIAASAFSGIEDVVAALLDPAARAALDDRIREHAAALRSERERLLELELALADQPETPPDISASTAAVAAAREEWSIAVDAAARHAQTATQLRDLLVRVDEAHRAAAELSAEHDAVVRLANTVAGRAPNTHRMTLEAFVLAAELEEIVEAANLRLYDMSAGRYRLQHTDALARRNGASGLGLEVMDAYTGQARPPQSLSGGETFLASLALALGLAEIVTGRAGGLRLDTLFIDEGFGSLDADTLDLAMRALDELRQGGRVVGVISHVDAMKEQLPAQLLVEATGYGPSVIRQDVVTPAQQL